LTRSRQEWTYARRFGVSACEDHNLARPNRPREKEHDEEKLNQTLTTLPESDRALIKHLFWEGRTETELANSLAITQQAVSKRKRRILTELRQTFADTDEQRRTNKRR
jgi:RNA polymerase sigma factor (sigma-70 family)